VVGRLTIAVCAVLLAHRVESAPVTQVYSAGQGGDQDDMAVWIHPTDPAQSTVITADKERGRVYVYDLDGRILQTIDSPTPGNVDLRYGLPAGGACLDVVAFNERGEQAIRVYRVDATSRNLERIDDGAIATGKNYGFTLYRHRDGTLYGYTGSKSDRSVLRQYRLYANPAGRISGSPTSWRFETSTAEGMAGDDETGYLYLAEESTGLWRVHALDPSDRTLVARQGESEALRADVEGVTIYYGRDGAGFLIVSSQGNDSFAVFSRERPHRLIGSFRLAGVGSTDGIDVVNLALGTKFPQGVLFAHNGAHCCPVVAARWQDIVAEVAGLQIDTASWDPRRGHHGCEPPPPLPASRASDAQDSQD
jgi:3-phytase